MALVDNSGVGRWFHLPHLLGSSSIEWGWWKSLRPPPWSSLRLPLSSSFSSSSSSWLRLTTACAAAVVGSAVSSTWIIYRFNPKILVQAVISWGRHKSGFASKTIRGRDGFVFSFGERGTRRDGQTIVILVPGLAGSIDNWVPVAQNMKSDRYMIAVEMPGGGLTSCDPETDLNILAQVERLKQFIHLLGFDGDALHLVGAATGATIVGCFAAIYPENVDKLTLICPAIRSAEIGDVIRTELSGVDSGMIFRSPETITKSLEVVTKRPIKLNKQIAKGIFEIKKDNLPHARKLADSLLEEIWKGKEDTLLGPRLNRIRAPTQVIWGQYDRVDHVSGVDVLRVGLRNCSSINILPCGHSIYMDEPKKLGELLEQFITARC